MIRINFLNNSYISRRNKRIRLTVAGVYITIWCLTALVALNSYRSSTADISYSKHEIQRLKNRLENYKPHLGKLKEYISIEKRLTRDYDFVFGGGLYPGESTQILVNLAGSMPGEVRLEEIAIRAGDEIRKSFKISLRGVAAERLGEKGLKDWMERMNAVSPDGMEIEYSLEWSRTKKSSAGDLLAFEVGGVLPGKGGKQL